MTTPPRRSRSYGSGRPPASPSSRRGYGTAGGSLGSAGATSKFGKDAAVGALGERDFADALERAGITHRYDVFYSLRIPNSKRSGGTRYDSDVDVAIVNGNRVILLDVKRWAAGKVYFTIAGLPFRGLSPMKKKNGEWRLSANMAGALSRYRERLPGVTVEALVVFVPTSKNGALPSSVRFLRWPGGIRSVLIGDAMRKIGRFLGETEAPNPKAVGLLREMLSKPSRPRNTDRGWDR